MNENITVTMTAKEFAKHNKSTKVVKLVTKLKYAVSHPVRLDIYNINGNIHTVGSCYKTEKKALKAKDKLLQDPDNIGKTVVIFSDKARSYTTAIPIVEVT